MLMEDESLIRNPTYHAEDVVTNNVTETGVKINVIWNEIPGYHVTQNCVLDIMHDLLEGVCNYDMRHIINYIVFECKSISFQMLNERIQNYDYSLEEASGKPPGLSQSVSSIESLNIKAIEMFRLVSHFAFMVGDVIPQDDEVWNFYLVLRQIFDLVLAHSITLGELRLLQTLIAEHHELYVSLFKDNCQNITSWFTIHMPLSLWDLCAGYGACALS